MQRSFWFNTKFYLLIGLGLLLGLVAVACGSAADPETIIEERIVEKEVIKEVEKEVIKEVEKKVEVMVVATPTPVPTPMGGVKTVDLFTIMAASQGNEVFNHRYNSAENNLFQRLG